MPHCMVEESAMFKIVFPHILFLCFLNAVWALTIGGFRIVSDTLVCIGLYLIMNRQLT